MPSGVWSLWRRVIFGLIAAIAFGAGPASAMPYLVVDAASGQVLIENEDAAVWYPASLTKLMTVYVALDAVRAGKLTLDTPLVMSARGARMPPSKMGFRPGTEVTLDNALKMLMVVSPNDVAVMVAEGVSGSVKAFADDMNEAGRRLGLHESHFVNPNGLHDANHVSSARDMAMIARAIMREFPEHADLFGIGALQLGKRIMPNHNGLLGRYPGADGMKTGFTCPAGFNVVASANRLGRRLIVVVLGSSTAKVRTHQAADLFDRGFAMGGGSGSLESLPASGSGVAPNMRRDVCIRRNAAAIAAAEEKYYRVVVRGGGGRGGRLFCVRRQHRADAHANLRRKAGVQSGAGFRRPGPRLEGPGSCRPFDGRGPHGRSGRRKGLFGRETSRARRCGRRRRSPNAPTVQQGAVRTPPPTAAPGKRLVRHAAVETKAKKPAAAK